MPVCLHQILGTLQLTIVTNSIRGRSSSIQGKPDKGGWEVKGIGVGNKCRKIEGKVNIVCTSRDCIKPWNLESSSPCSSTPLLKMNCKYKKGLSFLTTHESIPTRIRLPKPKLNG